MKTFSEAVHDTMMREVTDGGEGKTNIRMDGKGPSICPELEDTQTRYGELLKEIQNSPETAAFALGLIESIPEEFGVADLIAIAFSHGVMVGVEMEKP